MGTYRSEKFVDVNIWVEERYSSALMDYLSENQVFHVRGNKIAGRPKDIDQLISKCEEISKMVDYLNEIVPKGTPSKLVLPADIRAAVSSLYRMVKEPYDRINEIMAKTESLYGRLASGEPVDSCLKELDSLIDELERIRKDLSDKIIPFKEAVISLRRRLDFLGKNSQYESFFVVNGWVPEKRLRSIAEDLEKLCNGLVVIEVVRVRDYPPTLIRVPKILSPVQSLVNAFGLPKSTEINPTILAWLTFPLFFGMMFGDVGQGFVILLVGLLSMYISKKRKFEGITGMIVNNGQFLVALGIGAIIFGFIYGDLFGPDRFFKFGLFHPMEETNRAIIIALFVGVVHITTGIVLSIANCLMNRKYLDALVGPVPWLAFYLMFTYPIAYKFFCPTWHLDLSGIYFNPMFLGVLAIPLLIMLMGHPIKEVVEEGHSLKEALSSIGMGSMEVFEVGLESLGHTISYLRLWALNMAHEALMIVFIRLAFMCYPTNFIAGLVIELGGNLLVLTLEGAIAFMHALRLHWVEWFMKFYDGTGYPFSPFQDKRKWVIYGGIPAQRF